LHASAHLRNRPIRSNGRRPFGHEQSGSLPPTTCIAVHRLLVDPLAARCGEPVAALGLRDLARLRQFGECGADGATGEPYGFGDLAGGHRAVC
jgi:hypothetical protein